MVNKHFCFSSSIISPFTKPQTTLCPFVVNCNSKQSIRPVSFNVSSIFDLPSTFIQPISVDFLPIISALLYPEKLNA